MIKREILLGASVVTLAITLPFAIEAFSAINAQPCSGGVTPECFPWGAEGAAADGWRYGSKAAYIFGGILPTLLALTAVVMAGFSTTSTISKQRSWIVIGLTMLALLALLF